MLYCQATGTLWFARNGLRFITSESVSYPDVAAELLEVIEERNRRMFVLGLAKLCRNAQRVDAQPRNASQGCKPKSRASRHAALAHAKERESPKSNCAPKCALTLVNN